MKHKLPLLILLAGLLSTLVACNQAEAVQDVPNPDRVERKAWEDMTPEEKIDFVNKTPMPEEAKQRQIESIKAGKS